MISEPGQCTRRTSLIRVVQMAALILLSFGIRQSYAQSETSLHGDFTLYSGDYAVHFKPSRANQMDRIDFKEQTLGINNGNYGFAFHGGDMKFIGGSHAESGSTEKVLKTRLVVDGREIPAPGPAEIEARHIEFTTESRIRGIAVTRRVVVTPGGIERNLDLQVIEDTFIGTGYPYMTIWTPSTTEWMAQLRDGTQVEGIFDNQGWELKQEAAWVAVYEPEKKIAMIAKYSDVNLPGKGIRYALWDLAVYHKLYYQAFSNDALKAGESYRFQMSIHGVQAEPEAWKAAVSSAAGRHKN